MQKLIALIKHASNAILIFSAAVCHILLLTIVGVVTFNVLLRYVFNSGLPWGEELPCFVLLPGYVILAMVIGIKEDSHINLNVLPKNLPKKFEKLLHYLKYGLVIFIGAILTYYGIYLSIFFRSSILVSLKLPNSIQFVLFPVGGVLMILVGIIKFFNLEKEEDHIKSIITGYDPADENNNKKETYL